MPCFLKNVLSSARSAWVSGPRRYVALQSKVELDAQLDEPRAQDRRRPGPARAISSVDGQDG